MTKRPVPPGRAYPGSILGAVVKWGLLAALVALVGLALFRPATLFGVDSEALANSLSGAARHGKTKCADEGDGQWRCVVRGGALAGVQYRLTTHRFGCWDGIAVAVPISTGSFDHSVSGCIGLTDLLGD